MDAEVAMKPCEYWDNPICAYYILCIEDNWFTPDIKESKYEDVNTDEGAAQQKHLSAELQGELADILCKYKKLFDSTLGQYPHCKVHLELEPGARPVHQHPYSVAHVHEKVFIDELGRLCAMVYLNDAELPNGQHLH
jgi:hypothetical protein